MPRISPILTNFTAGEWSPQLYGRVDLAQYPNACRTMKNFIPRVHGGAQFRPGTTFIADCKDSTKKARLIPFQYSTSQAYVLEMGDGYLRFFKDQGVIVSSGTTPYEITTIFAVADVPFVRYCQDKDLMYLFHNVYFPQKLIRLAHNSWSIANVPFECGPFLPANKNGEVGSDLITNGDFEADSGCTDVGTPLIQKRTDFRSYKNTYSRTLVASAANDGFKMTAFTSVNSATYRLRARIYKLYGDIKITVRKGDNSGDLLSDTITDLGNDEWIEVERYFSEGAASGGAGAFVQFTDPGAVEFNTNLILNGTFETPWSWTPIGTDLSERSTGASHAGAYGWKLHQTSPGVPVGVRSDAFITETERVYRITFWVLPTNLTVNGIALIITRGDASESVTHVFEGLNVGTWNERVYDYIETKGGAAAYIQFNTTTLGDPLQDIYIDDVTMTCFKRQVFVDQVELYRVESTTITPSAKTGAGITLTASSAIFSASHIGAFWSITHAAVTGYVKIVSFTSSTVVVADVLVDLGDTTATTIWREGAWSALNGYPACGNFYEQRLICGNSPLNPDAVWGSKVTEYEDFTPGILATDSFAYNLQSDIVRWIASLGQLVIGTVNKEFRLGAQGSADALTPTNVKMTGQSRKGSADIMPIDLGNAIIFAQRHGEADQPGRRVRELTYNYINDAYDGKELTLLSEHITGAGIVDWALMNAPYQILWCVTEGGVLIGLTYEKEQNVIAWHRHETDGLVESVCVIPGENQDELWMIVNRTIGGVAKRYIEVMADFDWGTDQADCFFVDSGLTYDSTPATVFSGLDHLEGETVAILADGVVQTPQVVTGGSITLATAASVVHVGLPYTGVLAPMDLDGGAMEGTGQGKLKRLHGVAVNFYKTLGGYIGADEVTMEELEFPSPTAVPQPLYSGIKDDFTFPADWALEGRIVIKQTDPLPMTVLSIMPRLRTEDR